MIYIILSIYLLIGNGLTLYTYVISKKENDRVSELLSNFTGWRKFTVAFLSFLTTVLESPIQVLVTYLVFIISMKEK
jgi:hypothetical protein